MSAFPFSYDYENGRKRVPVFNSTVTPPPFAGDYSHGRRPHSGRSGTSVPVTPQEIRDDPYYQPPTALNQGQAQFRQQIAQGPLTDPRTQMAIGSHDPYQDARSERQRLATVGINARNAAAGGDYARADQLAGQLGQPNYFSNQQYAHEANARANFLAANLPASVAAAGTTSSRSARSSEPTMAQRAKAFRDLVGTSIKPQMPIAEARRMAGLDQPPATQPTQPMPYDPYDPATHGNAPAPQFQPQLAAQPNTAGLDLQKYPNALLTRSIQHPVAPMSQGGNRPQVSEQIAREMMKHIWEAHPDTPIGQLQNQFGETMAKYGVDGSALFNKWQQQGTLGKFEYAQPGEFTTTPAQSRVEIPLNRDTGAGGVVRLPSGDRVVLAQTPGGNYGRQVGGPIGHGEPLPPTVSPVMGPQPGFTPAPMLPGVATPQRPGLDPRAAAALMPGTFQPGPLPSPSGFAQSAKGQMSSAMGAPAHQVDAGHYADSPGAATTPPRPGSAGVGGMSFSGSGYGARQAILLPGQAEAAARSAGDAVLRPGQTEEAARSAQMLGNSTPTTQQSARRQMPESMARRFYQQAGGDPAAARAMAIQAGFDPSQILRGQ